MTTLKTATGLLVGLLVGAIAPTACVLMGGFPDGLYLGAGVTCLGGLCASIEAPSRWLGVGVLTGAGVAVVAWVFVLSAGLGS